MLLYNEVCRSGIVQTNATRSRTAMKNQMTEQSKCDPLKNYSCSVAVILLIREWKMFMPAKSLLKYHITFLDSYAIIGRWGVKLNK